MIDIYNKLPTDGNYKKRIETEDEMEAILAQIKMILGTHHGDVLGDPQFGVDIKQYIFSTNYNKDEFDKIVRQTIIPQLSYDTNKYTVGITVDFGHDIQNSCDYAVINVAINDVRKVGIFMNQY